MDFDTWFANNENEIRLICSDIFDEQGGISRSMYDLLKMVFFSSRIETLEEINKVLVEKAGRDL